MTSAPDAPQNLAAADIKAVCLDVDETLLDGEQASRRALRELVGTDRAWTVWQGVTERYYSAYISGEIHFDVMCVERTKAFFQEFGETLEDTEAVRREALRMAAMQRAWTLFDDVRPCLDWLVASGLKLAVVSNAPGDYQRKKIGSVGLAADFDAMAISGDHGVAKPDPRLFHAACHDLGLHPSEVAHVGDKLGTDAHGATRAGLRGIWLNRGAEQRDAGDIPVISSLDELPELLVADLGIATMTERMLVAQP